MKKACLLFGTAVAAASLFGSVYYDCLTNLAYAAARTNAHLIANKWISSTSNELARSLLRSSLESGLNGGNALSNSLNRVIGTGTAYGTTAVTNSLSDVTSKVNEFLSTFGRKTSGAGTTQTSGNGGTATQPATHRRQRRYRPQ